LLLKPPSVTAGLTKIPLALLTPHSYSVWSPIPEVSCSLLLDTQCTIGIGDTVTPEEDCCLPRRLSPLALIAPQEPVTGHEEGEGDDRPSSVLPTPVECVVVSADGVRE
jgi:hypothetical protein